MTPEQMHYNKMTKTPLVKLIVSLGIPTTISMLVTNIYNMVDTYFVGTLGESPQAATGILFALQAVIQALAFMLGQGSGTMVSKALADRDKREADMYVSTAFFTGISLGVVMMVLGFIFLTPLLNILGSTTTILPYAKQYGSCVLLSCPVMIGSFILNNNLRYEGKAFYAMIGLVSGSILNIFGDWLLVSVIPLGILGAGIATAVSQLISFIILLYFYAKKAQSTITYKAIAKKSTPYITIGKVGFPALIRQGLNSFSNGLLNNITRPYGDAAIAAMSIVNRFSAFVMCVGLGIGQGFQPVASFNYRAKEYARVKKGLLATMGIGFSMLLCIVVPGVIFSGEIVSLFQENSQVLSLGTTALRYACWGTLFLSISVPINMLFQSIRKPLISTILSVLRSGVMFIPTLLITTNLWGITGIQISQPLSDALTGLASIPFVIWFLLKKEYN
ncbi:MAG: MATE family efflux transporter [Clostridia bacterium]|nr:MATE family efflux transporter [Clostridia bacterium]